MNIFVVNRTPVRPEELKDPCWLHVAKQGHTVVIGEENVPFKRHSPPWTPDAIVGMGVTIMDETFAAFQRWPEALRYCYNWDVYEWVWTRPRENEYDYKRYGELLELADEVWVPSECTARRTKQWYPWVEDIHVILSACPYWEHPRIRDQGYALCCLREIPDPWWGVFEECCTELGIPYKSTQHLLNETDYRNTVADCRFICAPLYELSTGGLSLMEAYYHGKPVLLSDSMWNGGLDYFKDCDGVRRFSYGDREDFKQMLLRMITDPPLLDREKCRDHIRTNFSNERMAEDILRRITL